ncbi:DUF1801 domain-containing protein [Kordiimonas gwangyangensis]|uniref:DUF1801 domain-containing protein n=1 Tax=Kordiimonas gwangyangensis TaxID=288022 RepID=UPI0003816D2B|nr:DUF1801 domain-containing protein [Kordiimonas gwangyangensis]
MSVDAFMAKLEHPRKAEIEELRAMLLALNPDITEQVKWNAPSFCVDGDDRITLRIQPKGQVQVILHRGAKAKTPADFAFEDTDGIAKWAALDRGIVDFRDRADFDARKEAFRQLATRWIDATR